MGDTTAIQWADKTFNPWIGCQRVSPGCVNCYAEHRDTFVRIQARRYGRSLWGPRADRHITSAAYWRKPYSWNRAAARDGVRRRVFCASLADVFEDRRDLDEPRRRVFRMIEDTPYLDWLLLTKRIDRVLDLVPARWRAGFPENVWMGTSVENQHWADVRIPFLLQIPARIRFLSCEPLLGMVHLDAVHDAQLGAAWNALGMGIHWVIVGGESDNDPSIARPFDVGWAEGIIDQCRANRVACFVKQLGTNAVTACGGCMQNKLKLKHSHGGDWDEWPEHLRVREFPA